jgi:hypothetical protein
MAPPNNACQMLILIWIEILLSIQSMERGSMDREDQPQAMVQQMLQLKRFKVSAQMMTTIPSQRCKLINWINICQCYVLMVTATFIAMCCVMLMQLQSIDALI